MKEENKSVLVILGMFILALLIILPPLFRTFFPKEEITNPPEEKIENEEKLTCTFLTEGNYEISADISYINNNLEYYTVKYLYKATVNPGEDASVLAQQELEQNKEYVLFSSLNNISLEKNNNDVTISFDQTLMESNPENIELQNYFQDINSLKEYLTNIGYNCGDDTKADEVTN